MNGFGLYHKQGIAVSIGLHLCIIGILYGIHQPLPVLSNANGLAYYTIALQTNQMGNNILTKAATSVKQKTSTPLIDKPVTSDQTTHAIHPQKQKASTPRTSSLHGIQKVTPQQDTIDARSLYPIGKNSTKKSGVTLELPGWQWNCIPNPKDSTDECGKIVFEIKVDANGEIVSIRTIEKTVTPMVEKMYADALRVLTFSRTTDNTSNYNIFTGKVRFILVAK